MIFVSCNLLVAMRTSDLKVFSAFSLNKIVYQLKYFRQYFRALNYLPRKSSMVKHFYLLLLLIV